MQSSGCSWLHRSPSKAIVARPDRLRPMETRLFEAQRLHRGAGGMSSAAQVVKSSGWLCKWGCGPRSSYCGVHTPGRLSFVEMSTFLYIYTLIYTLQVIPRFLKHRLWKQLLYTIVVLNQTSDYKNLVMTLSTLPPPRATEQLFTNTSAVRGVIQPQRMARNAKKDRGRCKDAF